jgi:DNA gyrase inhibitor GyrI
LGAEKQSGETTITQNVAGGKTEKRRSTFHDCFVVRGEHAISPRAIEKIPSFEVYINDCMQVPPAELRTELYVPITDADGS